MVLGAAEVVHVDAFFLLAGVQIPADDDRVGRFLLDRFAIGRGVVDATPDEAVDDKQIAGRPEADV